MASNTETVTVERGTASREATRPPQARRPSMHRRAAFGWAAIITASIAVAALAVAAFTGGDDKVHIPATRVDPQAEQYELDAHLEGQAKTHGGDDMTDDAQPWRLAAQAEQYEREAHLEGQAKTYGGDRGSDIQAETNSTDSDPYDGEFLPGSRHVPTR
jgi:hypothetical protein